MNGYVRLAHYLGPDQPVYGLQAWGVDGQQELITEIQAMAASYLEAIRRLQPEGPYQLGGWSVGGIVAFEMAQQLLTQHQKVALLALFDAYIPSKLGVKRDDAELLEGFFHDVPLSVDYLRQLDSSQQMAYVLKQAQKIGKLPPEELIPRLLHRFQVYKTNIRAGQKYEPRIYPGRITFFQANSQPVEHPVDSAAWSMLAKGGMDIHHVWGSHDTLLQEPSVQTVAQWLKMSLL